MEIQSHIKIHKPCRKLLQHDQGLRDLPVLAPRSDFVRSILIKAKQRHERQRKRRIVRCDGLSPGFIHFFIDNHAITMSAYKRVTGEEITLAQDQIRVIKPALNSKKNPDSTTFPVRLPGNTAMQGFPKPPAISRQVRLRQGKNLLILPQRRQAQWKDLIALIEHEENKEVCHNWILMEDGNQFNYSSRIMKIV